MGRQEIKCYAWIVPLTGLMQGATLALLIWCLPGEKNPLFIHRWLSNVLIFIVVVHKFSSRKLEAYQHIPKEWNVQQTVNWKEIKTAYPAENSVVFWIYYSQKAHSYHHWLHLQTLVSHRLFNETPWFIQCIKLYIILYIPHRLSSRIMMVKLQAECLIFQFSYYTMCGIFTIRSL